MSNPVVNLKLANAFEKRLRGETQDIELHFSNQGKEIGYLPCIDILVPHTSAQVTLYDSGLGTTLKHLATVVADDDGALMWSVEKHMYDLEMPEAKQLGDQLLTLCLPYSSYHNEQPVHVETLGILLEDLEIADAEITASPYFVLGESAVDGQSAPRSGVASNIAWKLYEYRVRRTNTAPEKERAIGPNYPVQWKIDIDIRKDKSFAEFKCVEKLNSLQVLTAHENCQHVANVHELQCVHQNIVGTGASDVVFNYTTFVPLYHQQGVDIGKRVFDAKTMLSEVQNLLSVYLDKSEFADDTFEDKIVAKAACIRTTKTKTSKFSKYYIPYSTMRYTSVVDIGDWYSGTLPQVQFDCDDGHIYKKNLRTRWRQQGGAFSEWTELDSSAESSQNPIDASYYTRTKDTTYKAQKFESAGHDFSGATQEEAMAAVKTGPTTIEYQYDAQVSGKYQREPLVFARATNRFPSLDVGDKIGVKSWMWFQNAQSELMFQDTSANNTNIGHGEWQKSIYAIDDKVVSLVAGRDEIPDILPGQKVTFRLQFQMSHANLENIRINDFAPLPLFDVEKDFAGYSERPIVAQEKPTSDAPDVGYLHYGPKDTYHLRQAQPGQLKVDKASNSLQLRWETYQTTSFTTEHTIDLLYSLRATASVYSDKLIMTNQAQWLHDATFDAPAIDTFFIAQVAGRAPVMQSTVAVVDVSSRNDQTTRFPGQVGGSELTFMHKMFGEFGTDAKVEAPDQLKWLERNSATIQCGDKVRFVALVRNDGGADAHHAKLEWKWDDTSAWQPDFKTLKLFSAESGDSKTVKEIDLGRTANDLFVDGGMELGSDVVGRNGGFLALIFEAQLAADAIATRSDEHQLLVHSFYSHADKSYAEAFPALPAQKVLVETHLPLVQTNIVSSSSDHTGKTGVITEELQNASALEWLDKPLTFERAAPGETFTAHATALLPRGKWSNLQLKMPLPSGLLHKQSATKLSDAVQSKMTIGVDASKVVATADSDFVLAKENLIRLAGLLQLDAQNTSQITHKRNRSSKCCLTHQSKNIKKSFRVRTVEPRVNIGKSIVGGLHNYDNGDKLTYKVTVACLKDDSQYVAAYGLHIEDLLPSKRFKLASAQVYGAETTFELTAAAQAGLVQTADSVTLDMEKMEPGQNVALLLTGELFDCQTGEQVDNTATLGYRSLLKEDGARQYTGDAATASFVAQLGVSLMVANLTDNHTKHNQSSFLGSTSLDKRGLPFTWADKMSLVVRVQLPEAQTDFSELAVKFPRASHAMFRWPSSAQVVSSSSFVKHSASTAALKVESDQLVLVFDETVANTNTDNSVREHIDFQLTFDVLGGARDTVDAYKLGEQVGPLQASVKVGQSVALSEEHQITLVEPVLDVQATLRHALKDNQLAIDYTVRNVMHKYGTAASRVQVDASFSQFTIAGQSALSVDTNNDDWSLDKNLLSQTALKLSKDLALGKTTSVAGVLYSIDESLLSEAQKCAAYQHHVKASCVCSRNLSNEATLHATLFDQDTLPILLQDFVLVKQLLSDTLLHQESDKKTPIGANGNFAVRLYANPSAMQEAYVRLSDAKVTGFHFHKHLEHSLIGVTALSELYQQEFEWQWKGMTAFRRRAKQRSSAEEAVYEEDEFAELREKLNDHKLARPLDKDDKLRSETLPYIEVVYQLLASNIAENVRGVKYASAVSALVDQTSLGGEQDKHANKQKLVVVEPTLEIAAAKPVENDLFTFGKESNVGYRAREVAKFELEVRHTNLSDSDAWHVTLDVDALPSSVQRVVQADTLDFIGLGKTTKMIVAVRLARELKKGDVAEFTNCLRWRSLHKKHALDFDHVRHGNPEEFVHNKYWTKRLISCPITRYIGVQLQGSFAVEDMGDLAANDAIGGALQWGDSDYQDFIGRYHTRFVMEEKNKTVGMICDYICESHGAAYDHDLWVRIPELASTNLALSADHLAKSAVFVQKCIYGRPHQNVPSIRHLEEWVGVLGRLKNDTATEDDKLQYSLPGVLGDEDKMLLVRSTQAIMSTHGLRSDKTRPTVVRCAFVFEAPIDMSFFETSASAAECNPALALRRAPFELQLPVYKNRLSDGVSSDYTVKRCDGGALGSDFETVPRVLVFDDQQIVPIPVESTPMDLVWPQFRAWVDAGQSVQTLWWLGEANQGVTWPALETLLPADWRDDYEWAME